MNIFAHRNMNFYTEGVPGGMVFCQAGLTTVVPDDVRDEKLNPLFQRVVDAGYVTVLGESEADERGPAVQGGPHGPTGIPRHDPGEEDINVEREPLSDEDQLGPPIPQQEYELRVPLRPVDREHSDNQSETGSKAQSRFSNQPGPKSEVSNQPPAQSGQQQQTKQQQDKQHQEKQQENKK